MAVYSEEEALLLKKAQQRLRKGKPQAFALFAIGGKARDEPAILLLLRRLRRAPLLQSETRKARRRLRSGGLILRASTSVRGTCALAAGGRLHFEVEEGEPGAIPGLATKLKQLARRHRVPVLARAQFTRGEQVLEVVDADDEANVDGLPPAVRLSQLDEDRIAQIEQAQEAEVLARLGVLDLALRGVEMEVDVLAVFAAADRWERARLAVERTLNRLRQVVVQQAGLDAREPFEPADDPDPTTTRALRKLDRVLEIFDERLGQSLESVARASAAQRPAAVGHAQELLDEYELAAQGKFAKLVALLDAHPFDEPDLEGLGQQVARPLLAALTHIDDVLDGGGASR